MKITKTTEVKIVKTLDELRRSLRAFQLTTIRNLRDAVLHDEKMLEPNLTANVLWMLEDPVSVPRMYWHIVGNWTPTPKNIDEWKKLCEKKTTLFFTEMDLREIEDGITGVNIDKISLVILLEDGTEVNLEAAAIPALARWLSRENS